MVITEMAQVYGCKRNLIYLPGKFGLLSGRRVLHSRQLTRLWVTGPPVNTFGGETTVMSQQADFTRLCEPGEIGGRKVFAKLAPASYTVDLTVSPNGPGFQERVGRRLCVKVALGEERRSRIDPQLPSFLVIVLPHVREPLAIWCARGCWAVLIPAASFISSQ